MLKNTKTILDMLSRTDAAASYYMSCMGTSDWEFFYYRIQ